MKILDININKKVIHKFYNPFRIITQILIIIYLLMFSIETLPNFPPNLLKKLNLIRIIIVIIFTFEYLIRLIVSNKKLKFIFSWLGIIDLVAILSFYIYIYFAVGQDLNVLRVLRIFQLSYLLKIIHYNVAISRFIKVLKSISSELVIFAIFSLIIVYIAAVGIYYFENPVQPDKFASVFHCIWWAVVTLTTVGYGDVYPITLGGKIFTCLILMLGLAVIAVPTGLIVAALTGLHIDKKK